MRLSACLLAMTLCTTGLLAQSFTPVREQKNLSPAALATIHTLETLTALPAGEWRFHAGDLPHGESTSLDDSSWPLVTPRAKSSEDAVWYRRTIEVPKTLNGYDISGSRIWFQLRASANGPMPEIIYFNGRRVALGDDLEPIVLFEPAKPGDKVLVAVKLLRTVDVKTLSVITMRVEPIADAANTRPSAEDIRTQIVTAANILPALPTPRKDLLPKVEEAAAAIDLKALAAANQPAFDASLKKAQAILSSLQPVISTAKIDLAGNSHIDAAWLWPASETIDVVKRTFTTALQLMNEYPDYTFTQSAAQYSEWMAEKYPALNEQIKQRIKEGRWEIVGGMWIEPDLNMPDGESYVRQLLVGQRTFQKLYGVQARIGWNPDSFGYNWQLPQIYKRSGLDYFVTQKMHWNDTNILPFRLFWWQSPDGSKVLTYFPTDYVHDNVNPTRLSADFAETAERNPGTTEMLDLYGIGDHGGGPTRAMLDQADHWIALSNPEKNSGTHLGAPSSPTASSLAKVGGGATETDAIPTMRYHTAQQYFTDVESKISPESKTWDYGSIAKGYTAPTAAPGLVALPTWNSELYFEYHRGVMTTQAHHKNSMRRSEVATLDAEKMASFAWLYGCAYPAAEITESWKKITFNQFHDLAAGSGIGIIYKDAQRDYTEVFHSDREITQASVDTLEAQIDTASKGTPILVTNTLAWPRSEMVQFDVQLPDAAREGIVVLDSKGQLIPSQTTPTAGHSGQFAVTAHISKVPALGYAVLHVAAAGASSSPAPSLKADSTPAGFTLSNAHLKLTVDRKNGCITSLVTLPANIEFLTPNACGNQLQTYKDTPKQYDAWNIDPGTLDGPMTPITALDAITLSESSPLRKTVHISRSWQQSKFTQDISLDADADTILVSNDVDWHETHVLLKAAFTLAHTSPKATFEIPYGSIERTTLRSNSWEKAQFEVPALRWADLGDATAGLSLLNDSKYAYDAVGNTLRLTLLRSPTWPDPEADRGPQHFTYALYPHAGPWKQALTVHRAYELNDPLTARQVFSHTGPLPAEYSFAAIDNPNVTLTAIKKSEDADALTIRMVEWAGTPTEVHLHVPPGATAATETNMMERPEGPQLSLANNLVTVPIKPYEILTVQVAYSAPAK